MRELPKRLISLVERLYRFLIFFSLLTTSFFAHADFISVKVKQAVLFEGPSNTTDKVFIVTEGYPLEVLVSLKDWKKVKDHNGKISWIESKNTHNERTVLITKDDAVIFNEANEESHKLANVEKFVVLKLNSPMLVGNWAQVKTQIEGLIGFINAREVWGL
jgi:SH3-like domain-containing protein